MKEGSDHSNFIYLCIILYEKQNNLFILLLFFLPQWNAYEF